MSKLSETVLVDFPENEDLTGAAMALLRLQDTYALATSKLAKGQIQGVLKSPTLSGMDSQHAQQKTAKLFFYKKYKNMLCNEMIVFYYCHTF